MYKTESVNELTFQWRRCLFQPGCFCFSPLGVTSAMNMQWPLSMSWWGRESFIDPWAHSSLCSETKRRWSLRGAQWRLWSHMKASRVNPLAMACGELWLPSYTTGKAFIGHTHLEKKKSPFGICYNLKNTTNLKNTRKNVVNLACFWAFHSIADVHAIVAQLSSQI